MKIPHVEGYGSDSSEDARIHKDVLIRLHSMFHHQYQKIYFDALLHFHSSDSELVHPHQGFCVFEILAEYIFLASLAVTTFVGHNSVALCWTGLKALKPLRMVSILATRQFLSSVKVLHNVRRCTSVSTYPSRWLSTPVGQQYTEFLSEKGILGRL